jgi:endo-1,4-beta-xylanase
MKFLTALCVVPLVCLAADVQEIPLRPMKNPAPDVFVNKGTGSLPTQFTVVNRPSIYVFLPPKEKATGVAVVVAPGGGHSQLVIDKEGWEMADWFNQHGIAAFVLKYRLARAANSTYTVQGDALDDAKRAHADGSQPGGRMGPESRSDWLHRILGRRRIGGIDRDKIRHG